MSMILENFALSGEAICGTVYVPMPDLRLKDVNLN